MAKRQAVFDVVELNFAANSYLAENIVATAEEIHEHLDEKFPEVSIARHQTAYLKDEEVRQVSVIGTTFFVKTKTSGLWYTDTGTERLITESDYNEIIDRLVVRINKEFQLPDASVR